MWINFLKIDRKQFFPPNWRGKFAKKKLTIRWSQYRDHEVHEIVHTTEPASKSIGDARPEFFTGARCQNERPFRSAIHLGHYRQRAMHGSSKCRERKRVRSSRNRMHRTVVIFSTRWSQRLRRYSLKQNLSLLRIPAQKSRSFTTMREIFVEKRYAAEFRYVQLIPSTTGISFINNCNYLFQIQIWNL